jgi:hypothetical protein
MPSDTKRLMDGQTLAYPRSAFQGFTGHGDADILQITKVVEIVCS